MARRRCSLLSPVSPRRSWMYLTSDVPPWGGVPDVWLPFRVLPSRVAARCSCRIWMRSSSGRSSSIAPKFAIVWSRGTSSGSSGSCRVPHPAGMGVATVSIVATTGPSASTCGGGWMFPRRPAVDSLGCGRGLGFARLFTLMSFIVASTSSRSLAVKWCLLSLYRVLTSSISCRHSCRSSGSDAGE